MILMILIGNIYSKKKIINDDEKINKLNIVNMIIKRKICELLFENGFYYIIKINNEISKKIETTNVIII